MFNRWERNRMIYEKKHEVEPQKDLNICNYLGWGRGGGIPIGDCDIFGRKRGFIMFPDSLKQLELGHYYGACAVTGEGR